MSRAWPGPGPAGRRSARRRRRVAEPGCRTTIRSTRSFQTDTRCSTTTRVAPVLSRQRPTASRTSRTPAGSRLAVGSSSRISPGRIARMPASARRCFCPPDRADVGWSSGSRAPARRRRAPRARARQISSAGHREVLRAEGDVVAEAGEHHLRFRVLLHQPGTAALGARRLAVDQQAAGLVGVVTVGSAAVVRVPLPRCCRRARRRGRGAAWICRRRRGPAAARAPRAGCPGPGR